MSAIHYARSYLAILVFLQVCWMVTSLRLKIAVEKKMETDAISSRTKRSTSACSNYHKIDPNTISYNLSPKPWDRPPAITFVSDTVTQGMEKALMARVPGLGETTIKDVFDKLKQDDCICLPFGGSVRDQFLGRDVLDIDADTPCDVDKVVHICKQYWDSKYCKAPHENATLKIVHIGNQKEADGEEIDLANWNKTFFGELTNLEYTTNSLGYYDDVTNNRGIVIDFPGSGVNDTCNMVIKIPVPPNQWEGWYHNDYWRIFRYFKLRAKGYSAEDKELPSFIERKTKEILRETYGKKVFRMSFFKYALSGDYNAETNITTVPYPACTDLAQQSQKKNKYYDLFKEVLGEYWENKAKALLDEIKIECPDCGTGSNQSVMLIVFGVVIQYCGLLYI